MNDKKRTSLRFQKVDRQNIRIIMQATGAVTVAEALRCALREYANVLLDKHSIERPKIEIDPDNLVVRE
jgi:hypothetical protein